MKQANPRPEQARCMRAGTTLDSIRRAGRWLVGCLILVSIDAPPISVDGAFKTPAACCGQDAPLMHRTPPLTHSIESQPHPKRWRTPASSCRHHHRRRRRRQCARDPTSGGKQEEKGSQTRPWLGEEGSSFVVLRRRLGPAPLPISTHVSHTTHNPQTATLQGQHPARQWRRGWGGVHRRAGLPVAPLHPAATPAPAASGHGAAADPVPLPGLSGSAAAAVVPQAAVAPRCAYAAPAGPVLALLLRAGWLRAATTASRAAAAAPRWYCQQRQRALAAGAAQLAPRHDKAAAPGRASTAAAAAAPGDHTWRGRKERTRLCTATVVGL
jgi:hypothetical protein